MTTEPDLTAEAVSEISLLLQGLLPKIMVDSAVLRLLLAEHLSTRADPAETLQHYRDHLLTLLTANQTDKALADAMRQEIQSLFQQLAATLQ